MNVYLERDTVGRHIAWQSLAELIFQNKLGDGSDVVQINDGESWEHVCSSVEGDQVESIFRHRSHPIRQERVTLVTFWPAAATRIGSLHLPRVLDVNTRLCNAYFIRLGILADESPQLSDVCLQEALLVTRAMEAGAGRQRTAKGLEVTTSVVAPALPDLLAWALLWKPQAVLA